MKITDLYEENGFLTGQYEIIEWMKESFAAFYPMCLTIESDGLVYSDNDLFLKSSVSKLEVQFKSVTENFNCSNTKITSLEGCPQTVGGDFSCSYINITTLKYCPKEVARDFYCYGSSIVDPKEYRWALYCDIGKGFHSSNSEVNEIINTYSGSINRKDWARAINLLSKVKL